MFSVSDLMTELIEASCGRRGCKADIILPCDDLDEAEKKKREEEDEEEFA
jgi:hypothetical protein